MIPKGLLWDAMVMLFDGHWPVKFTNWINAAYSLFYASCCLFHDTQTQTSLNQDIAWGIVY